MDVRAYSLLLLQKEKRGKVQRYIKNEIFDFKINPPILSESFYDAQEARSQSIGPLLVSHLASTLGGKILENVEATQFQGFLVETIIWFYFQPGAGTAGNLNQLLERRSRFFGFAR